MKTNTPAVTLTKEALAAIENGNLIQAIKQVRIDTGLGLKESKDAVEAYLNSHADVKEKFLANKAVASITQEQVIHVVIVVAALMIGYWLFWK